MAILNSNFSKVTLSERVIRTVIQLTPIRRGKERIVDIFRKLWNCPEGTLRQAMINKDILIVVDIFERIQSYMYFIGDYERHETQKLINSIKPGDVLLDIGANIGYYSLIFSKITGKEGRVFAFEVSPKVYQSLCQNCLVSKNQNISTLQLAIADKEGMLMFNLPRNSQEQGSGSLAVNNTGDIEVLSTTIDEFLQKEKIPKISLIKMDIEGAELKAFLGMEKTIIARKPKILFEFSPTRYEESDLIKFNTLVKTMKKLNYKFQILTRNGKWKYIEYFPTLDVWTIYAEIQMNN